MEGLKELSKKAASIKIGNISFEFRVISLADEIWLAETYGDKLTALFSVESFDLKEASRVLYHQLINKEILKKQTVKTIDEDGNESNIELGGLDLFRQLIIGYDMKIKMIEVMGEIFRISHPDEVEDVKKKTLAQKISAKFGGAT